MGKHHGRGEPKPHERISTDTNSYNLLQEMRRDWRSTRQIAGQMGWDSGSTGGHLRSLENKDFVEKRGPNKMPEWRISVLGMGVREYLERQGETDE